MVQNSYARRCTLLALAFMILVSRSASADSFTFMWDFNTEPDVDGYVVHVGPAPGTYSQSVDVGNTDRFVFSSAVAGQQYCFVVLAYAGDLMSPPSAEVCGTLGTLPTLEQPANQTSTVGQNVTLQLNGGHSMGATVTYTATGLPPGLLITQSLGLISGVPTTEGSYSVTGTATAGGLSVSRSFTWTIEPANRAPALTSPGSQTTDVNTFVALQLQASDADADTLSYAASGLPTGLQISQSTGAISGTAAQAASFSVTVTVTDGELSASQAFTWTVRAPTFPPAVSAPSNQTTDLGAFVVLDLQAADPDGDPLTWSATGLPPGLQIGASTGRIIGSPTMPGSYAVTVTVNDGSLEGSASFTWTVNEPNAAPVLTPPADRTTDVNAAASLQLQASDADGDALTYGAVGLPPGLSLGASTGLIAGTPTVSGVFAVAVSVSDGAATATGSFTWTVQETTSGGVSLSNPGTKRHNVGQAVSLQLHSNSSGALTFSASNLPPGLSLNGATGLVTGTPTTPGTYTVIVSVTDGTATATQGFTWIIRGNDAAPALTNPGSQTHDVGDAVMLQLQASDANGDTLTYAATGLPSGMQIDTASGRIFGVPTTTHSYSVSVSVTDGTLTATQTFTWTIVAVNVPPTLAAPGNPTSTVGQAVSFQLQGADIDGDPLTYWASGVPAGLQLNTSTGQIAGMPTAAGTFSVTATVSDGAQSASRSFTWTVLAAPSAPTLAAPGNQTGTVGQPATLQLQGADANGDTLIYTTSGLPPGLQLNPVSGLVSGTPTAAGTYSVTAQVSDGALAASRSFTWSVAPQNVAPTLSVLSSQSTAEGDPVALDVQGADANGDPLTYAASGLPPGLQMSPGTGRISGTATASGTYTVTVVVSDGGLSAERSFTWTVVPRTVAARGTGSRSTANAVYTGTTAALRQTPAAPETPVRQYAGSAAPGRTTGTTTPPVTPKVREYTGAAGRTRPVSEPAGAATYTGPAVVASKPSPTEIKSTALEAAMSEATRSVATVRMAGSTATDAGAAPLVETSTTVTGGTAVSAPRAAPSVSIDTPVDYESFAAGATVIFVGRALDAEDGPLSHAIVWTSSLDGRLGTGSSFTRVLSPGTHVVAAHVIDSDGNARRSQVTVLVAEAPAAHAR
jgi:hypothetical protein